jgi:nitroreductase
MAPDFELNWRRKGEMESNAVLEAILRRRTIRHYTSREVGEGLLLSILEAGRWAPSGKNGQPWRFIVVREEKIKEALSRLTRYGSIIAEASVVITVFLDAGASYDRVKDLQAIGACMENMLLAGHSLGLGASWQGEILNRAEEVEGLLGVPPDFELMAILTLGYPARTDQASSRKEIEDLVWLDRYGNPLPR